MLVFRESLSLLAEVILDVSKIFDAQRSVAFLRGRFQLGSVRPGTSEAHIRLLLLIAARINHRQFMSPLKDSYLRMAYLPCLEFFKNDGHRGFRLGIFEPLSVLFGSLCDLDWIDLHLLHTLPFLQSFFALNAYNTDAL